MAEIINLNKERKARQRAASAEKAATNRVRHGRTAAERKLDREAATSVRKVTDGARLDPVTEKPTTEG